MPGFFMRGHHLSGFLTGLWNVAFSGTFSSISNGGRHWQNVKLTPLCDKVDGTAVYGADQKKIGTVERAMIDKLSGKVAYPIRIKKEPGAA